MLAPILVGYNCMQLHTGGGGREQHTYIYFYITVYAHKGLLEKFGTYDYELFFSVFSAEPVSRPPFFAAPFQLCSIRYQLEESKVIAYFSW